MKVWQRPVVAVPLAMVVLALAGGIVWQLGERVIAEDRRCHNLDRYLGGSIPEGATDFRCTDTGFQERWYEISFSLPRERVDELRTAFPHAPVRPPERCRADLCLASDPWVGREPGTGMAGEFDLWATYQDERTVRVEITAHGG